MTHGGSCACGGGNPPALKESEIRNKGLDILTTCGLFAWIDHQPAKVPRHGWHSSAKGVADILGCHKGRMFGVEVKTPDGEMSAEQEEFAKRLRKAGGFHFVARGTDDFVKIANMIRGFSE